jgi:hypothetical protein
MSIFLFEDILVISLTYSLLSVLSVCRNLRRIADVIGFTDAKMPMQQSIATATDGEIIKSRIVAKKARLGAFV